MITVLVNPWAVWQELLSLRSPFASHTCVVIPIFTVAQDGHYRDSYVSVKCTK